MVKPLSEKDHPGLISIQMPVLPGSPGGGGGDFYVAFVPRGEKTEIWGSFLGEYRAEFQEVVPWPTEWREIAGFLCYGDAYVCSEELVEVGPVISGLDGYAAEVVALSSLHDGDPPLNDVVQGLVSLSDNQISSLYVQYDSSFLYNDDFARDIYTIMIEMEEIEMDKEDLSAAFERADAADSCDINKVLKCLPEWKAEYEQRVATEEQRLAIEAKQRAEMLSPYREQIDAIVLIALGKPPRTTPGYAGLSSYAARRYHMLKYVEDYVLAHKSLPSGEYDFGEVPWLGSKTTGIGKIDFGKLRSEPE